MILKVFKDRQGGEGWMYIGDAATVHVDISGWGITHPILKDKDDHRMYEICGVRSTRDMLMIPDRDVHMVGYHLMLDPENELRNVPMNEKEVDNYSISRLKVITVTHSDESIEVFVVSKERRAWLLSDSGQTIDRL